jgi:hypothetical protein
MPPDANELGWKETLRIDPLEDAIVAMRPVAPTQPFDIPNSVRLIDPTMPEGELLSGPPNKLFQDPSGTPIAITGLPEGGIPNHYVNYGWEYVQHCHLLGHEEMDMMHPVLFGVAPRAPSNLIQTNLTVPTRIQLDWQDNSLNEVGFTIERADDIDFTVGLVSFEVEADVTTYTDSTVVNNNVYYYRVQAFNVIGDTMIYPAPSIGFPHVRINSAYAYVTFIPIPILAYNPVSYDFGTMTAGQISSTSFEIWNSGTGTLTYSLSESATWVTVTPTSGDSTGEHDMITISIDTTGLSPGPYTCPIGISSDGGSGTFTVYVNIVTVIPVLSYNPISYSFGNMLAGQTASSSFQIWNSGTGTLTYSLSESATWLTISPTSGSSTGEYDTITVNVDTTGLSVGLYTHPISITSDGGSGTFTVDVTVVAPTEVLDQQQTQFNNNFALYLTRWVGQSFIPTVTTLTRAELYMRKTGSPPTDAVLSIRSSISGPDLVSISKPASQIPTTNSWVVFDFSDLSITPGSTYYLVLKTTGGTITNCYYWNYGSGTPYTNGLLWYSATGGSSWTQYATYDFCFKTYGFP